jgi:hypothetical protein
MPPNLEELTGNLNYPATRADIVANAGDQEASEEAVELLRSLPREIYYNQQELNIDLSLIGEVGEGENLWSSGKARDLPDLKSRIKTKITGKGKVS